MYLDDITEFTDYKRLAKETEAETCAVQTKEKQEIEVKEPQRQERKTVDSLFPDSITHWGSRTGLVKSAIICNEAGKEQKAFSADDRIRIDVRLDIEEDMNVPKCSLAISIKNTEGIDILVKTTYDEHVNLRAGKNQTVSFVFQPRLANGDYYLVVALENRENAAIAYYEYIEGAAYFKAYSDKK